MQNGNSVGGLIKLRLLRGINESNAIEFQGAQDEIRLQSPNMDGGKTLLMDLIRQLSMWSQWFAQMCTILSVRSSDKLLGLGFPGRKML